MALKRRIENAVFKPGGKYFQRKARIESGEMPSLKDKIRLRMAESAYKRGMAKANKLSGVARDQALENLANKLYSRGVMKTYKHDRKEQSIAHKRISSMTASAEFEKIRSKK